MTKVALYLRVSTDDQTTENQERQLCAVADRHGWEIVRVFTDHGISGAKGRDKRPGLDDLHKAVARKEFDLLAAWSCDRLGRSLKHLIGLLDELDCKGIDLFLLREGMDTSTPGGKALFQMAGVFAEFERGMIRERVKAGMARAKINPNPDKKPIGRPRALTAKQFAKAKRLRAEGVSIRKIAAIVGPSNARKGVKPVSVGTISKALAA